MIRDPELTKARRLIADDRRKRKSALAKEPKANPKRLRERDPGFLQFLRRQPCCVGPVGCSGPVEAAHVRFADATRGKPLTGLQTKPDDRWCVNLCAAHHRNGPDSQHGRGERLWWCAHGINPLALAEHLYDAYKAGL